jgi:hypothetical protein
MKTPGILVAAAILLGAAAAGRAQPVRDARRSASGTAVVSGTVVTDDLDSRPLRRARVTCSAPELSEGLTAVTDERGRFTCAQLPAGRYSIHVTRDGWVPVAYGARRPLRPGTPVAVADGQHADVVVRMMRGAVITGALVDERGQPAVGVNVVALRSAMDNGERRLIADGAPATTDDRGVYRVYGLPPGDYVVGAGPSESALSVEEAQVTTDLDLRHAHASGTGAPPPERRVAFASTYYPGTTVALQASPITLRPGEERTDIDFALRFVATARIEGALTMPDGSPAPSSAQLTLLAIGPTAFAGSSFDGLKTTRPGGDGTFAFSGVTPGVYTLLARLASPAVLWAASQFAVEGEPMSGLNLSLQPALSIAGRVRIDGSGAQPPFSLSGIKITAEPVQATGEISIAPASVTVDRDGRFEVRGVTPGRYRLIAALPGAARSGGWMQRSAIVNGVDALDIPATIAPNQVVRDAVVTLTDRPARVSGVLQGPTGTTPSDTTIVLFPADPTLRLPRSRRIQAARPAPDGAYAFGNLAPGEYLLAAIEDVEPGEWFDPAFLERLVPAAIRVTLGEGEARTETLRIGPGT